MTEMDEHLSTVNNELIPWRRFCEPAEITPTDTPTSPGFLENPEGYFAKFTHPNLYSLESLLESRFLVLCAEPGMGKSKAIEQLREAIVLSAGGDSRLFWRSFHRDVLDAPDLLRQLRESVQWKEWLDDGKEITIVIDAIDEGLAAAPTLVGALIQLFRGKPIERLRLILACRDIEWPKPEGEELRRLWPQDAKRGVYRLKQLRWIDAHQAALHWGASETEASAFMDAVHTRGVEAFAARPITLEMLFKAFQEGGGELPQNRVELFRNTCMRLCQEDEERIRRLRKIQSHFPADRLYSVAGHISTRMLLGRHLGTSMQPVEKRSHADLGLEEMEAPADEVNAALETALFADGGHKRRVFAHPTYGEFMTAEHIAGFSLPQLQQLLSREHGGQRMMVPQLGEVAAWASLLNPEFCDWLIVNEPETVLRNDASILSDEKKRALVAALLHRMKEEQSFDEMELQRFYESLDHPDLPKQLRPYITNKRLNRVVRRFAIHLADNCGRKELLDECLRVALDPQEDYYLRTQAINAAVRWIPDDRLEELEPLALCELGPDPDDNLRAGALKALVPKRWKVSRAVSCLKRPWNDRLVGEFQSVCSGHLPESIEVGDLPALFSELNSYPNPFAEYFNLTGFIAKRVLGIAVQNLVDPEIVRPFLQFLKKHVNCVTTEVQNEDWKNHFASQGNREAFILCLLSTDDLTEDKLQWVICTLVPILMSDCNWVLNYLAAACKKDRCAWVILATKFWPEVINSPNRDDFLEACEKVPELKGRLSNLLSTQLGTPQETYGRESWRRMRESEQRKLNPQNQFSAQAAFQDALERALHDAKFWPELAVSMQRESDEKEIKAVKDDLTQRRFWREARPETQKKIKDIARRFLLECGYDPEEGKYIPRLLSPAFWAIVLLHPEIEVQGELASAVKAKWLRVIEDTVPYGGSQMQEMMALAMKLDPERCRKFLLTEMDAEIKRGPYLISSLGRFRSAWDGSLSLVLTDFIETRKLSGGPLRDALFHLAQCDENAAKEWLRPRVTKLRTDDMTSIESSGACAAVALGFFPGAFWESVWGKVETNDELARRTFQDLVFAINHRTCRALGLWTEHQLSRIYFRLEQVCPGANDPPLKSGEVTDSDNVRDFRRYLKGTLENRATDAACEEFLWLAKKLPSERTWLRWHWKNTLTAMMRKEWDGTDPNILTVLEKKNEARWVTNQDDLFDLILESNARFQEHLRPKIHRIWDNPSPKAEKILSQELCGWLEDDLGKRNGIVAGCEIQPSPFHANDILVTAVPNGAKPDGKQFSVVLEVKRHFHPQVATALEDQLVKKYLVADGRTHGIYIVGWYNCAAWQTASPLKVDTLGEAKTELEKIAQKSQSKHPNLRIAAVCLDCGNRKSIRKRSKGVRKPRR